jgi:hypothetical protein
LTPTRHNLLALLAILALVPLASPALLAQAPAKLLQRYRLDGGLKGEGDQEKVQATFTKRGTFTMPPRFDAEIPPDAAADAPARSLRVGQNKGSKKTGLTVASGVLKEIADAGSLSLWVRPETLEKGTYLLACGPIEERGLGIRCSGSGTLDAIICGPETSKKPFGGFPVPIGEWTHVALVWKKSGDAIEAAFYVRGSGTGKQLFPQGSVAGNQLSVGGFSHHDVEAGLGAQFDGNLYDLQFYKGTLTNEEVAALAGRPGSTR